jgi:hypothetical protein
MSDNKPKSPMARTQLVYNKEKLFELCDRVNIDRMDYLPSNITAGYDFDQWAWFKLADEKPLRLIEKVEIVTVLGNVSEIAINGIRIPHKDISSVRVFGKARPR